MKFALAIVRRANVTTAAVMDGPRLFDFERLREREPIRLGRRLTDLACYYEAATIVVEVGSTERLGYPAGGLPRVAYEPEVVRQTLVPDYSHGDGKRLQALIKERYPELGRFLPKGRITRPEHTSLIAAIALGLTHHLTHTHAKHEKPAPLP